MSSARASAVSAARSAGLGGLLPSLVAVVAAGVAMGLSWQPYGVWPLLIIGLPTFTLTVFGARLHRAFGLGYVFGLAMLTVTVSWVHVLGWWVAALLIVFMALFFGILGVALSLVSRLKLWPLAAACCWVMVEFIYSRAPLGGFGWTRIAYAAVDTPLAGYLPMIGVVGLSFLVALVGQLIAWAIVPASSSTPLSRRTRMPLSAGLILILLLGGMGLRAYEPEPKVPPAGTVNVGVVQGDVPGRGIEALGRARSVTNNHLSETVDLMTKARLGQVPMPDFILWPENSTDIDPQLDPITRSVVWSAAKIAGRPILVGAVTAGPGEDERQTTAMWWDPSYGVLATYHKRDLVPFGEWIPFRAQLLPLVPILAEVGAQSVPGTTPGVLSVPLDGRELRVGDVICFELAYDKTVYQAVQGSQVLMVQSNNATYGGTGQIEQQFAITRARAMEARREIAVATTNSVSGYIDRDGKVLHRTAEFTSDSFVETMPLRSAITPALLVAPWLDRGLSLVGLLCCLVALVRAPVRTSRDISSGTLEPSDVRTAAVPADQASVPRVTDREGPFP